VLCVSVDHTTVYAQILIETPAGERRMRYELCDERRNCRMVEQTVSYPICDEHHNCQTVNAFESGKAKIWDQEELLRSGTFVFNVPGWL